MAAATILVVDDDPAVLQLTSCILTGSGYEVARAANAEQALEIVKSPPPRDLVLSDSVMPGMQGPELLEEVRRVSPATALILMSGYTAHSELPPGASFLAKPFAEADLLRTVEEVLTAYRRP